ncbi:MAG: membrane protein insertase YidC [bacterium]
MFDKRTILAFVLIFVIFILWQTLLQPQPPKETATAGADTAAVVATEPATTQTKPVSTPPPAETAPFADTITATLDTIPEQLLTVETEQYYAQLSNKGGGLVTLYLKGYTDADSGFVYLIPDGNQIATPALTSKANDFSDQQVLYQTDGDNLFLTGSGSEGSITFSGYLPSGSAISKQFTFYAEQFHYDVKVTIEDLARSGIVKEYVLTWLPGLPPSEHNLSDDYDSYKGGALVSGETFKFDSFEDGLLRESESGNAEWAGSRTKYFGYALIPQGSLGSGAYFEGREWQVTDSASKHKAREISAGLVMPVGGKTHLEDNFRIYAGPLDYQILNGYNVNLENFIDWGWKIIQPFSYAVYWVVYFLHKYIPNYGVVIFLVALLLKVFTYPLSKKQLNSIRAMQRLQPQMEELKAKFKDNPQKMNQAVMKLYKEEGVNPLGSCLYMLPQMPFFFGLYQVFRVTFEFRQAYFLPLWPDLSQPDSTGLYIMPIIMAAAMFFQQKISMTDPKHKMMVYLMPILFFFMFKSLAVGLVLYWTSFSVLSIIETLTIKRPQQKQTAVVEGR